ncbi:aldehyde dehydrogenase (NADP(+)) [Humisphaera borealis]|uniref:Aldehyde dehydrogenase family protein n=1 Tax=Humisphaera borealis TaxID=2807512 RepID=A0A7M2X0C2_9BACT|nr:aldehyde dehydrogenase (NADP(+)) [Humisphaera borealis]QOV91123.1 aldehyde dehydrogenase family protein [Humisphaera borealis]
MNLHGKNLIGGEQSGQGETFAAVNPATSQALPTNFHEGTAEEADRAMKLAHDAFQTFRKTSKNVRASLLENIALNIEAIGDALLERANLETALGIPRLTGERARTCFQLRMFARLAEDGSWVDARIDKAIPDRKPLPRPDLRRMLIGMGPVVSFSSSNFPLAISVAGNDLVSAFAAGCPIVVKNHPNHPGTSEIIASAITKAIADLKLPHGIFSMINGRKTDIGMALVKHPLTEAVAFTGSLRGGRAIFDAANSRPVPIPVFAEMGSVNPVFLLPGALAERGPKIAEAYKNSMTVSVGQMCTNPGVVVGLKGDAATAFVSAAGKLVEETPSGTMLYAGIRDGFEKEVGKFEKVPGVSVVARSKTEPDATKTQARPTLLTTDARTYLANPLLKEEAFGPASIFVAGESKEDLLAIARTMDGSLTATIHGTPEDLKEYADLVRLLEQKAGRLVFNGFPTGVEVVPSQQHGGPYPSTTDVRTTSVGTAAIQRFVRPVSYQDFPQSSLPDELKDENPLGIWRMVEGKLTKDTL